MRVLGLHIGHNATAALVEDGRVCAAVQEERLTRTKNAGGIPVLAIPEVLRLGDLKSLDQVDAIAVCGTDPPYMPANAAQVLQDYAGVLAQAEGWLSAPRAALSRLPACRRVWRTVTQAPRHRRVQDGLSRAGLPLEKVQFVDHHTCHAAMAYYGYGRPDERVLVLTNDAEGDSLCATVSIGQQGRVTRLAEVSNHHTVAGLYAMVTYLLGMVPLEHEYKVMGLAPYGMASEQAQHLARTFEEWIEWVPSHPMVWRRRRGMPIGDHIFPALARLIARKRFDHVAAGLQLFTERFLTQWVARCVRETGIRTVCVSGGVFMNVKANQRILAMPEVERLFIVPSCGDESNACGAALALAAQTALAQGRPPAAVPLSHLYWGGEFSAGDADQAITRFQFTHRVAVESVDNPEGRIAELLASGQVVARVAGRMEFGARALGNRSILAPASDPEVVRFINEAIKGRDFWMPFAPSILRERSADYLCKPKPMEAPYMVITFDNDPATRSAARAAMHPYDGTLRPQEVSEEMNPAYHRLLMDYAERTGHGLLLNTSYNLHGEPLVSTPTDALRVFDRSGLPHLVLGPFHLRKA